MRNFPAFLLALTVAAPLAAAVRPDVAALVNRDGLQPVRVKNIDLAYARPGASLAAYRRVQIEPVLVEFSKSWNPERTGSRMKLSAEEREALRASVALSVRDEFAREMQATGHYQVVDESGPDVLRVTPRIVGLYLNAPDAGNVGRTRTFTRSAGELTLVAELQDSASNQTLMLLADRSEANDIRLQRVNGLVNDSEIRSVAGAWARVIRGALDRAQGVER